MNPNEACGKGFNSLLCAMAYSSSQDVDALFKSPPPLIELMISEVKKANFTVDCSGPVDSHCAELHLPKVIVEPGSTRIVL